MATLLSPGIQISINDQSQYVNSNVGSVPLVLLATAQDKRYNSALASGTTKANAGKLQSFTSQRELVTAMGTPTFQLSSAGTVINAGELNEYGLLTAYSALGLGNQLYAIRADVDLNQLVGTSVRPAGNVADDTYWLDLANTEFGIYSLNTTPTPDIFVHQTPILITDASQVYNNNVDALGSATSFNVPTPLSSVGTPGSFAYVFVNTSGTTTTAIRLFYKATIVSGNLNNTWLQVGSTAWQRSLPTLQASVASPTLTLTSGASTVSINGTTVTFNTGTVAALSAAINAAAITGVTTSVVGGLLTFFVTSASLSNGSTVNGGLTIAESDATNTPLVKLNITAGTYWCPIFFNGNYAQQPTGGWLSTDTQPRPTGSIWVKTTSTGVGYSPSLKKYSQAEDKFVPVSATLYSFYSDAINGIDPIGGGVNVANGTVISQIGVTDGTGNTLRFSEQSTLLTGEIVSAGTGGTVSAFTVGNSFTIAATLPGATNTALVTYDAITLTGTTAASFVSDILASNTPYVTASLNSNGTITITHTTGGLIQLTNVTGTPLTTAGFVSGQGSNFTLSGAVVVISNFNLITSSIEYSLSAPYSAPDTDTLWYYSNPADIDIMINNTGWKGYRNGVTSDARGYDLTATDPAGVIVSASQPTSQSDATVLVAGDLWLDSGDLINYPSLYRYTGTAWVEIDTTDQITSNGIIFADARWDSTGTSNVITDTFPSIVTLLSSNFIDQDAPDYRLYPRGTLLFNTRRSGYNIKKYVADYFNATSFPTLPAVPNASSSLPSTAGAWVSVSGLDTNGVMKSGSAAQRSLIVAALQSAVDSNVDVREDNYNFNLLVAPGYPELIDNLVALNDDRTNTGFVIGDTPMTLAPNTIAITAWNSNTNGDGLATASPYLAVYYPAGLTNDLAGNSVAVPASHAVLRTFLYSDNISQPWFAPAGSKRGLVANLSDIGYVDVTTGSFIHNGINQGLRDTLYTLNINPITQLPGTGLVVWGQETKSGDTTSRNRINVVRLENYLRRIFKSVSNGFLFEPNDTITRRTLQIQIESALHDVLSKRGLYDFLVICDTSNNTPSIITNNQLYVDVAIEPIKDVEFIYIPIALYNPGVVAQLGLTRG